MLPNSARKKRWCELWVGTRMNSQSLIKNEVNMDSLWKQGGSANWSQNGAHMKLCETHTLTWFIMA